MAGEIAQETAIALTVAGASIGAGGSILSQVVAGLITGRREKRKARAEDERWRVEADAKRRDRNYDRKVALFASFMASAQAMWQAASWDIPQAYEAMMKQAKTPPLDEIHEVAEEIGILAPEVYQHIRATYASLLRMHVLMTRTDRKKNEPAAVRRASDATIDLKFWIDHAQAAIRAYVSHEPIAWPEQELAERKKITAQ